MIPGFTATDEATVRLGYLNQLIISIIIYQLQNIELFQKIKV
jgi:hypothetical protein